MEGMHFPGWYTKAPTSKKKEQPAWCLERLPVSRPLLQSNTKAKSEDESELWGSDFPLERPFTFKKDGQLVIPSTPVTFMYSKRHYLNICADGVTSVCDDEVEFLTFEQWEHEYDIHCKLIRMPFFVRYQLWRPFRLWHLKVCAKKFHDAKECVQKNLFLLNKSLYPALMDIVEMCYHIGDLDLYEAKANHSYTLQEFQDVQFKHLQEISTQLKTFHNLAKEVAIGACNTSLLEAGFMTGYSDNPDIVDLPTSIAKKFYCVRLVCFIRLVDYLIINALHIMVGNSVIRLLAVFQEHVQMAPTLDDIQSWSNLETATKSTEEENNKKTVTPKDVPTQPMFISELMLGIKALTYKPSEENFKEAIADLFVQFQETVLSVERLVPDPDFKSFTQLEPKKGKMKCEDGHNFESILENDTQFHHHQENAKDLFQLAFASANVYLNSLEHFQLFYKENESQDLDALQQHDQDVSFLTKALELYHNQYEEILAIQQKRCLGLLLVDTTQFKEKLLASVLHVLEAIKKVLTKLAKKKLDAVYAKACETQFKLEFRPSNITEYVDFLKYLDVVFDEVQALEEQQKTVCELYEFMNMFSVPTPPEDVVVFTGLESAFGSLVILQSSAAAYCTQNKKRFCTSLRKDMKILNQKINEILQKSDMKQILDIQTDPVEVRVLLGDIQISVDEVQAQASVYASHQKYLKMEEAEFPLLECLSEEVRLKQLLWDSLEKFSSLQNEWTQSPLKQLDLEQLKTQIENFTVSVAQMQKFMPNNNVLSCLKDKVEFMKERLPVITDLCNPCMKSRHWEILETVLGTSLSAEKLSLAVLEEHDIISYCSQIQEVSAQASGEASVEMVIKKVEDSWKTVEFTVLPHSDSRDVFILGPTDSIQVLLDDSIGKVSTAASSKYVGFFKPRVDKLGLRLSHFRDTLEEWLKCQKNWLKLQSTFSSFDIMQHLFDEYKMFLKVDRSWKEIMANVNKMPNALRTVKHPGLLQSFQENNVLLNQIQKGVQAHLESQTS
ncbi:dynein heavy chain 6, axonemal-like isoform X3 [Thalassophryne amazonica]|nr:dynein heavy chain 6, axonemal-like isoform X3 [Thalassophryne amazonica]